MTFIFQLGFSQSVDEIQVKRNYLKAYFNLSDNDRFLSSPRFAIGRSNPKNNFHELELSDLNFSETSNDQLDRSVVSIGFKYEYGLQFHLSLKVSVIYNKLSPLRLGKIRLISEKINKYVLHSKCKYCNTRKFSREIYSLV